MTQISLTAAAPSAATIVTTAADIVDDADGLTSLREAILYANAAVGTDTIAFDARVFDAAREDRIRLTQGEIVVTDAVAIDGGARGVTVSGDARGDDRTRRDGTTDVDASGAGRLDDNSRIFRFEGVQARLEALTLTGGRSDAGGAIWSDADLTLADCTVAGNSTFGLRGWGGGVFGNDVYMTRCTVSDNRTTGQYGHGAGVFCDVLTVEDSTVSGNRTSGLAAGGGGLQGVGGVTLLNSTVSGNTTLGDYSAGGGLASDEGLVTLKNSTVTGNVAAGLDSAGGGIAGPTFLYDSIVSGNASLQTQDQDVRWPQYDLHAISSVVGVDCQLLFAHTVEIAPGVIAGKLADNGGPTRTVALALDPANPAIGHADPATALATDQRGVPRDARPDIGAFEATAPAGVVRIGGPGADVLVGNAFDDVLCGRGGSDRLWGRAGADVLKGGGGRDLLRGDRGDDTVFGGDGRDTLHGGMGDDVLHGGADDDIFQFSTSFGSDTVLDFDAARRCGQDWFDVRDAGVSVANFDARVTIDADGEDTRILIEDLGEMLCVGVSGEGGDRITSADFLLLA